MSISHREEMEKQLLQHGYSQWYLSKLDYSSVVYLFQSLRVTIVDKEPEAEDETVDCESDDQRRERLRGYIRSKEKSTKFLANILGLLEGFDESHDLVVHGLSDIIKQTQDIFNRETTELIDNSKEFNELLKKKK